MAAPGARNEVRVRLAFEYPPPALPQSRHLWFMLNTEHCRAVTDVSAIIRERFFYSRRGALSLYLDGCLLPPGESVRLIRDNDAISVKWEDSHPNDSPQTFRKRQRSENESDDCKDLPRGDLQEWEEEEHRERPKKKKKKKQGLIPELEVSERPKKKLMTPELEVSERTKKKLMTPELEVSERTKKKEKKRGVTPEEEEEVSKKREEVSEQPKKKKKWGLTMEEEEVVSERPQKKKVVTPEEEEVVSERLKKKARVQHQDSELSAEGSGKKPKNSRTNTPSHVAQNQEKAPAPNSTVQKKDPLPSNTVQKKPLPIKNNSRNQTSSSSSSSSDTDDKGGPVRRTKPGPPPRKQQGAGSSSVDDEILKKPLSSSHTTTSPVCNGRLAGVSTQQRPVLNTAGFGMGRGRGLDILPPRGRGFRGRGEGQLQNHFFYNYNPETIKQQHLKEDVSNVSVVIQNPPKVWTRDYSALPLLTAPPPPGQIIAFKLLELTENYTPEVSDYKEGRVLSYDPVSQQLEVEVLSRQKKKEPGKFDLVYEAEDGTDIVEYAVPLERKISQAWSTIIEPRLVTEHGPHGHTAAVALGP